MNRVCVSQNFGKFDKVTRINRLLNSLTNERLDKVKGGLNALTNETLVKVNGVFNSLTT